MAEENAMKKTCTLCGEREAVIFVKLLTDEGKEVSHALCPNCAVKFLEKKETLSELTVLDQKLIGAIEEMRELLSGIVSNISAISNFMEPEESPSESTCAYCHTDFETFKESGRFGCPYCYSEFSDYIAEFAFELERGTHHRGKMPPKYASIYVLKKEISYLNSRLKLLVDSENYEEAEKIRKKLNRLIGNYRSGESNEVN